VRNLVTVILIRTKEDTMRKVRLFLILVFSLLAIAATAAAAPDNSNFNTHLSGDEEVPARDVQSQGQAIFHISEDALSVDYKLNVSNIENVIAGHIHLAPFGVNGPVVVNLVTPSCTRLENGVRCEGTFTAANLVGPLAGHPLSDLLDAVEDGNTYVNVHTTVFPGGQIRGQIDN
jgi:hypothetical protein